MKNNSSLDNKNRRHLIAEWIARAEDDQTNVEAILKYREGTPAHVCFLSQQIAEKYLKTLLLFSSGDFPKTHDLNQLATLLQKYIISIMDDLKEEIILLNPYYVGTRYPADIPLEVFTWKMAEQAFAADQKIKEFVLERIK